MSPNSPISPNPPQADASGGVGSRGLKTGLMTQSVAHFLDSRLRGNDRRCEGFLPASGLGIFWAHAMRPYFIPPLRCSRMLPRVWGCPPTSQPSPKNGGQGVESKSCSIPDGKWWAPPTPLGGESVKAW